MAEVLMASLTIDLGREAALPYASAEIEALASMLAAAAETVGQR